MCHIAKISKINKISVWVSTLSSAAMHLVGSFIDSR